MATAAAANPKSAVAKSAEEINTQSICCLCLSFSCARASRSFISDWFFFLKKSFYSNSKRDRFRFAVILSIWNENKENLLWAGWDISPLLDDFNVGPGWISDIILPAYTSDFYFRKCLALLTYLMRSRIQRSKEKVKTRLIYNKKKRVRKDGGCWKILTLRYRCSLVVARLESGLV